MADINLVKKFAEAIKETQKGTEPYDTPAEVVRIEDNTAWVHIPGGVDETPVQLTVSAQAGDTVQVRVGGGTAWITGNASAPPTDDRTANTALGLAEESNDNANKAVTEALQASLTALNAVSEAGDAKKVATNYLSVDETGIMVADMTDGTTETPSEATTRNVFIDSDSVDIRDGQDVLASFGEETRIGREGTGSLRLAAGEMEIANDDGAVNFSVLASADTIQETIRVYPTDPTSIVLTPTPATGTTIDVYFLPFFNHASFTAGTSGSVTLEYVGTVTYTRSADPDTTPDLIEVEYLSTGYVNSLYRVTYKANTIAPAFTLGTRNPNYPQLRGFSTAIGRDNAPAGLYSLTQGLGTVAKGQYQTAIGKYNKVDDANAYALIVGNGSGDSTATRSDAFTVDWDGNISAAGDVTDGNGTSISDVQGMFTDFFITKEYTYAYSNLNAGSGLNISATQFDFHRPTGYVPIAVLRTTSGSVNVSVIGVNILATGSVSAMVLYNHSNAARSYTASITILYARSSLVTAQ